MNKKNNEISCTVIYRPTPEELKEYEESKKSFTKSQEKANRLLTAMLGIVFSNPFFKGSKDKY